MNSHARGDGDVSDISSQFTLIPELACLFYIYSLIRIMNPKKVPNFSHEIAIFNPHLGVLCYFPNQIQEGQTNCSNIQCFSFTSVDHSQHADLEKSLLNPIYTTLNQYSKFSNKFGIGSFKNLRRNQLQRLIREE